MSWQLLLAAPMVIQAHAFAALAALLLGVIQFVAPKGTLPHKTIGMLWLVLMTVIAVSSIFVNPALAPGLPLAQWFSWIHIFTIATLYGVVRGAIFLVRGGPSLKKHKWPFIGIYVGGLVIAGGFAFMPGRIMHQVLFGS